MVWTTIAMMTAMGVAYSQAPQTHQFTPDRFYNTYSVAHPPALRIKPGDRVVPKTVDAAGTDWNGNQVSPAGNPQTGPFYVEGAEPDDVLVVAFEKIETNRRSGYSGSLLAPYTLDPQAIAARVDRDPKRLNWTIDKAKGVVILDDATLMPAHLELPLRPMLGCVAVAPSRKEAIAAITPGAFGGNMDYAGVTAGTGVETSMDVVFTVSLLTKKSIGWPRLEDDTHIMVLGIARPLLEAFYHATTEMQRWLMSDYGFSERGASAFMGQALE